MTGPNEISIPTNGLCLDHDSRIKRNTEDIVEVKQDVKDCNMERDKSVRRVHGRLDIMQWSIAGAMFVVAVEAVVIILKVLGGG